MNIITPCFNPQPLNRQLIEHKQWRNTCRQTISIPYILDPLWKLLQLIQLWLFYCLQVANECTHIGRSCTVTINYNFFDILFNYVITAWFQSSILYTWFFWRLKTHWRHFFFFFLGGWNGLMAFLFNSMGKDVFGCIHVSFAFDITCIRKQHDTTFTELQSKEQLNIWSYQDCHVSEESSMSLFFPKGGKKPPSLFIVLKSPER